MARRNRNPQPKAPQPAPEPRSRPTPTADTAMSMMDGVRFADDPNVEAEVASGSELSVEDVLPPEALARADRIAEMDRAFQSMNRGDAAGDPTPVHQRPIAPPPLPALSEEMVVRLRPKLYRIVRSQTASGGYQIPAGVMRVRTPGVSLVELQPGQIITDRDYDVERLRRECGVVVEDYSATASA